MGAKRTPNSEGDKFKQVRLDEKLNQEEFGERLHRNQPTIQKYESGALAVPSDVVKLLNKEFNISLDWFYLNVGPKKHSGDKANLMTDLKAIRDNTENMEIRIKKLEDIVKKLIAEVYEKKHQK